MVMKQQPQAGISFWAQDLTPRQVIMLAHKCKVASIETEILTSVGFHNGMLVGVTEGSEGNQLAMWCTNRFAWPMHDNGPQLVNEWFKPETKGNNRRVYGY